jgi:Site-specific DNA methylase
MRALGRTHIRGQRYTTTPSRRRGPVSGPVTCDLYAGAGIFSSAFAAEGFRLAQAVELDVTAAETYASQVDEHIEVADVRASRPKGRCDVLIAGPPCQGFSTLGHMAEDDPRNTLSLEVVRWARKARPRIVVVENVAAFAGSKHHTELLRAFEAAGYVTKTSILDALAFGVAQRRARSFTFASIGRLPEVLTLKSAAVTVEDAIGDLPAKANGENYHYAPIPGPLALARMCLIPEGGDKRDVMRLDPGLVPRSWRAMGVEVTDAWGRLRWDQPSNTLRTGFNNASKGRYIHPGENRVISLREAARLHSIPDWYQFAGWPGDVARQIGNSVPYLLGRAIARAVMAAL